MASLVPCSLPPDVGTVKDWLAVPSPPEAQLSGSLVPYRPSAPHVPGPVASLPFTLPLQSMVPVSPPEVNVPELPELDRPGARVRSNSALQGVPSAPRAGPSVTSRIGPSTISALSSVRFARMRSPFIWGGDRVG